MSNALPQSDFHDPPHQPPRRGSFATGCMAVLAWAVLGLSIGAGGGYFVYSKKPAEFQSTALIQVSHQTASAADESVVIASDPVLLQAVNSGNLDGLPGLQAAVSKRSGAPAEVAAWLRQRTNLSVKFVSPVYQVRCSAASPSDSEAVTNAIVTSYIDHLSAAGDQADWQSSIELLQSTRTQGLVRIAELERQLGQLSVPANASLQDAEVISAETEKWNRLQSESERLHNDYIQAVARLRQTESLIAEGAPADEILAALGMTYDATPAPDVGVPSPPDPVAQRTAEQRKNVIAERERIRAEVQRDLKPLQEELDRLLKIVASEHPKVRGVQLRMQKVRERLDNLPRLPTTAASPRPTESVEEPEEDLTMPSKGTLITARLRTLRTRRDQLAQQMADTDAQLEQSARLVSQQKIGLQEDARIRRQIETQQQLVERAIEQLAAIPTAPPVPQTSAMILQAASPGVQVAPWIGPHLLIGGGAGLLIGLVLAALFLLTSGTAEPES